MRTITGVLIGAVLLVTCCVAARAGEARQEKGKADAPPARPVKARAEGVVYEDANSNGKREEGEKPLSGILVHDEFRIVRTDEAGRYSLDLLLPESRFVVVSPIAGYEPSVSYCRAISGASEEGRTFTFDFGLKKSPARAAEKFRFVAISDPHIISKGRADFCEEVFVRASALEPAFFVNTGDISHKSTREAYDFYKSAKSMAEAPVFDVQGNHDRNFRDHLGPVRYCFEFGKVHFISMGAGYSRDKRAKGQWLRALVPLIPAGKKIVFFNHYGPHHDKLGYLKPRGEDVMAMIHGHGHRWKRYEVSGVKCFMVGYMAYYGGFSIFDVDGETISGHYVELGKGLFKKNAEKEARWKEIVRKHAAPTEGESARVCPRSGESP
jgi:predicted phosphodiesterase